MKRALTRWTRVYEQSLKPESLPESWQRLLIALTLLGVLIVRLLTISAPALDRTHWREIDHLVISQNYWQRGISFFLPEINWPAEPPRVTPMEFPLVPYAASLVYRVFGFNAFSARAVTLLAFLLLTYYVFKLTKRELGPLVGIVAAFAAGIMPLHHLYGRFLFSEPLTIAMSVVALYHLAEGVDYSRGRDWLLFTLTFSLAIAVKLESLYLLLPIFYIGFRRYKWQLSAYRNLIVLVLFGLIFPAMWYSYAYYLENTGVHAFSIFKGHNKFQTLTMLTDAGWYQVMFRRMTYDVLGGKIGTLLVIPGLILGIWERKARFFLVYLLTIGIYFALVAEGQLDASYRQLTSVPPLSVLVALGAIAILLMILVFVESTKISFPQGYWRQAVVLIGALALITLIPIRRHSEIRWWGGAFNPAHPDRWRVAQEIKSFTGPDSKLVVAGEYSVHVGGNDISPVLYYYTGLQGWTLQPGDWQIQYVRDLIQKGATHFVALRIYGWPQVESFLGEEAGAAFIQEMKEHYKVLSESSDWVILDLQQPTYR